MSGFQKKIFAKAMLNNAYDISELLPLNEGGALKSVFYEIDELLDLNKLGTKEKRMNHFKVQSTKLEDYSEKYFELGPTKCFLAGIRHVSGDPKMPFVHLTFGFDFSAPDLEEASELIKKEFSVFKPTHYSFWKGTDLASVNNIKGVQLSRQYLAGKISSMDFSMNKDTPIKLVATDGEDCFEWCDAEYDIFKRRNPELKNWVVGSSKKELVTYQKQGLLYQAYHNDILVGLIGAEQENLLGLEGLYIGELLISHEHRGKGLAAIMQKQFLKEVGHRFQVVWGTIDSRTQSSLKTALKVGRKTVRTEFFIPMV